MIILEIFLAIVGVVILVIAGTIWFIGCYLYPLLGSTLILTNLFIKDLKFEYNLLTFVTNLFGLITDILIMRYLLLPSFAVAELPNSAANNVIAILFILIVLLRLPSITGLSPVGTKE